MLTMLIDSSCSFLLNFSTRCRRLTMVAAFTVDIAGLAESPVLAVRNAVPNSPY